MPAEVVVVLEHPLLADALATAIRANGRDVQTVTDPMDALTALEQARTARLLIASVQFQPGKPNGRSLALMARLRRPAIGLIFICDPVEQTHVADLGPCLSPPIDVAELATLAERLLSRG